MLRRDLLLATLCLASPAFAQVPVLIPSKPPVTSTLPIAPGSMVQVGKGMFIDSQGNVTVESLIQRSGLVDVRDPLFAVGCANSADQTGSLDSLCAILNAQAWIAATAIPGAGYARLYFPHGHYVVGSLPGIAPNSALLHLTKAIGLEGDGPQLSVLENLSQSSVTVQYDQAGDCNSLSIDECQLEIKGMLLTGAGGTTTSGGLEVIGTGYGIVHDVQVQNFGAIGINLEGASERWVFDTMSLAANNRTLVESGDTNEMNYTRVNVDTPGIDRRGYCYSSPTCVNHALPVIATGATWYPSSRAAVFLDGVKNHWRDSSLKALVADSGIHVSLEAGDVEQNYFEGFPWGGQPRFGFAVEMGGKQELSHTTAPMLATDMSVPIDDALWTAIYAQNPLDLRKIGSHGNRDQWCAYPGDYAIGSTVASVSVPSITKGTRECLQVLGSAGDGKLYFAHRGPVPVAWPAGTVIEQTPPNGYGRARIAGNHLDSISTLPSYSAQTYLDGCDDQALRANWVGSPSRMCATVLAGYVPDGYAVPLLSQATFNTEGDVTLFDNPTYTGGTEADGLGWVKVGTNGYVNVLGERPWSGFQDPAQIRQAYSNGSAQVAFMHVGSAYAQGAIYDMGARATIIPSWNYFDGEFPQYNQGLARQHTGNVCEYNAVAGSTQPNERSCFTAGGQQQVQMYVNGAWVAQPAAHVVVKH